jgi:hypothetical protein
VVAGLIAVALAVTACGGTGPGATPTSSASALQDLLRFSRCVRSHGVPDFPDPDSQGGFEPSQISELEDSPQLKTASAACKGDLPAGATAPTPETESSLLKFAQCMRSHGEPDYPDPGGPKPSPGAIDPTSPQFQHATKDCQSLLTPSSSGGGGG